MFSFPARAFPYKDFHIFGARISNIEIIILVLTFLCAVLLNLWISRSRQGMAIRAIAYSAKIPPLLGIHVDRMSAATMAIGGMLAGLSGTLMTVWVSGMAVSTGHSFLLKGFAIVVLGGVGSIRGCVLAAFILAFAETGIVAFGAGNLRDLAAFSLIVLILLFRPQGLFGTRSAMRA